MVLVDGFTVAEAAAELNVNRSRIKAMISNGDLIAERSGSRWIIPRHAVFERRNTSRLRGRPYGHMKAWTIIGELEDGTRPISWLQANWHTLRGRAARHVGRALPDVLEDLMVTLPDDVVAGGVSAASAHSAAVRADAPPYDLYTLASSWSVLESELGFRALTTAPNLIAHIVPDEAWSRVQRYGPTTSLVVASIDLHESADRAAAEVDWELGR